MLSMSLASQLAAPHAIPQAQLPTYNDVLLRALKASKLSHFPLLPADLFNLRVSRYSIRVLVSY